MSLSLSQALRGLAAALMFLTRLPLPARCQFAPEHLQAGYFPFAGILIGGFAAATFWLASLLWSLPLAMLLALAATIWATGAFHEDGFADCCDGFGGGWDKAQILQIMQDSRLGTYGTIGLVLILAIKYVALLQLPATMMIPALLIGHSLSRLVSISHLCDLPYVRFEGKSKPVATALSRNQLLLACASIAPLWLLLPLHSVLLIGAVLAAWRLWFKRYMQRWIGGYTGDCLGASQQVSEALIYLALTAN